MSDLSKLSKPYFKEFKNKIGSNLKVKKEKYFKENLKVFMLKIVGKNAQFLVPANHFYEANYQITKKVTPQENGE